MKIAIRKICWFETNEISKQGNKKRNKIYFPTISLNINEFCMTKPRKIVEKNKNMKNV